jgi:thiamine transporter ThiT
MSRALELSRHGSTSGIATVAGLLKVDQSNDRVNVGTALTIHSTGYRIGNTNFLHSNGFELNHLNITGVATVATLSVTGGVTGGVNATGVSTVAFLQATTVNVGSAATVGGDLTVTGNLTVNGTTTNLNSVNLVIEDKNIILADVATPTDVTADGGGITLKGASDKTFTWSSSASAWTSSEDINVVTGKQYEINGTAVLTSTQVLGKAVPSGVIVGTSDSQTLTNKTLTTPVISSISNTGTLTLPTATTTLVGRDTTDTLTNKTIAAGSNTISGLTNSNLSGTAGITNANLANSTISGVALGSNLNTLTMGVSGTGLSGSTTFNGSGAATFTVTSNATNANTVSAIVARDASGNFSAGTITATLTGNVTGNVSGSSGSCTGNSATVTTNANLTGDVTSVGNATAIAAGVIVDADINASAGIADTKLATISTAGKVSNSATTATNANTASAIVARDASGNFSAGTITAVGLTLSGDLTVNGTTTTINSTTVTVDDKNIELGSVASPTDVTADGGGITLKGATDKTFNWVSSTAAWTSSENLNLLTGKVYEIAGTTVLSASQVLGKSMPSGTVVGTTDTQTLTNKTIAAGSNTISGLTNSNLSGTAGITNANLANSTISGVALGSNLNTLTMGVSGTGLSGSTTFNGSGAATFTVTSNATSANTGSTVVARDASGNFTAGTITAALTGNVTGNVSGSSGSCTGNSATATTASSCSGNAATATNVAYSGLTGVVPTWNQNTTGTSSNITAYTINQSVGTADAPTHAGLTLTGNIQPNANNTIDCGSSAARWRNVYSNDLDLSNEGKGNSVDGTWGSYLIQEGEESLYIINRRSGKKFRFVLEELV